MKGEPTGIYYVRVSDEKQVEGTSLASQPRFCEEYAARNGITILESFVDEAEDAKSTDRTNFNRALLYCQRHRVDYFIVYKVDRFARNREDHVTVRALLARHGTKLRSVTEPIDETPIGRAMEGMLMTFAELDNDMRAERTRHGMIERVQQGVWVWQTPTGYIRPPGGGNIVPSPTVAPFVRLAFEEYSRGTYSHQQLADFLAERGFRRPNGKPPTAQFIRHILLNPVYCGIIRAFDGEYLGSFEPLISTELFAACQPKKKTVHAEPRTLSNPKFPLRGLVSCGDCERKLTASAPRGRFGVRYPYYHHYNQECSAKRNIPKAELEETYLDVLREYTLTPSVERFLRGSITSVYGQGQEQVQRQNARIKGEMSQLEAERQKVFDLHRKGIYTDEEFREQKRLIALQTKEKSLSIVSDGADFVFEDALDRYMDLFREPAATWLELEDDHRARLDFQVLSSAAGFTWKNGQLRTTTFPLSYQYKRAFQADKNDVVPLIIETWNQLMADLRKVLRINHSPLDHERLLYKPNNRT